MNAKVLRMAICLLIAVALVTLLQPLLPDHSYLAQFFHVTSFASFGIALLLLAIVWFLYISGYRYARQLLFWQGVLGLLVTGGVLVGYFSNHTIFLERQLIPVTNRPFLLNLSLMFLACYAIQIVSYWLPRTRVIVNACVAVILFMVLLSTFGHLYNIPGIREDALLLPMPFGTILFFLVLSLIVFAHTNHMARLYLNSQIVISFAAMFIAILGANIAVYKNINKTVNVLYRGGVTQQVLFGTYSIDLYLDNAQLAIEAYETSGNQQYIVAFQSDRQGFRKAITALNSQSAAVLGSSGINRSIVSVAQLGNKMFAIGNSVVSQKHFESPPETIRSRNDELMSTYVNQAQVGIQSIDLTYDSKLKSLSAQESSAARSVILGLSTASSLSLLFIIFTPLFIRETIRKLSIAQANLRRTNRLHLEEKSRAEAVLASISDGLFAVDNNKLITVFNHAAEEMTGLRAESVLGRRYDELSHFVFTNDHDKTLDFTEKALHGTTIHLTHHAVLGRQNGQRLGVQVSASPIRDITGLVVGAIIVFRDRSSEQALENAKDEFVSLVSHQLRTPATATKQFLAMFLQGYGGHLDKRQRRFMQEAYDNNELGLNIIEDLLNITRLESNKLRVVKEKIEVAEFLRSAIKEHEAFATRSEQRIRLVAPTKPIYIETEVNLLDMAVDNLITNALKYSNAGQTVTVRLTDGKEVRIAVSDNGIGIKNEDIPKIFERFIRLEDPQKQYISGSGIGLYLVKKIAKRLHATIRVESEYGKGSTFTLTLKPLE